MRAHIAIPSESTCHRYVVAVASSTFAESVIWCDGPRVRRSTRSGQRDSAAQWPPSRTRLESLLRVGARRGNHTGCVVRRCRMPRYRENAGS